MVVVVVVRSVEELRRGEGREIAHRRCRAKARPR
jgi:hypothetical protein